MKVKNMVNYQKGKIYKVVNDVNDIVYIGSTTKHYLSDRMAGHRCDAKSRTTTFMTAMQQIGVEHFKIILIKLFPCGSLSELLSEEYAVMQKLKDDGIELYNTIVDPHENKFAFKRGSVIYDQRQERWQFITIVNGKRVCKSFSIKKWGSDWSAHKMAILWQDMTYPRD